jgi:hypothetical protein
MVAESGPGIHARDDEVSPVRSATAGKDAVHDSVVRTTTRRVPVVPEVSKATSTPE